MLRLFTADPLAIVTVVLCLATVILVVRLLRRFQNDRIRFLLGIVGCLCVHQGMRLLHAKIGWLGLPMAMVEELADLLVIGLCLVAVLLLGTLSREHNRTRFQLRLSEADSGPSAPAAAHSK